MGKRTRVFVVDDHAGVRAEVGDAVDVAGEAADVASAVSGTRALQPTWYPVTPIVPTW